MAKRPKKFISARLSEANATWVDLRAERLGRTRSQTIDRLVSQMREVEQHSRLEGRDDDGEPNGSLVAD